MLIPSILIAALPEEHAYEAEGADGTIGGFNSPSRLVINKVPFDEKQLD